MHSRTVFAGSVIAAFAFAQGGFNGPGRYEITNERNGKALALDPKDQTTVAQVSPRGDDSQQWFVEPGPSGAFYIRSVLDGRALTITKNARSAPVICQRLDRGPAQQWRIDSASADGKAVIVALAGGRVIDIPNGSNQEGLRIQIYDRNGDPNQRFIFRRIEEGGDRERERRERWEHWEQGHH